MMHHLLEIAVLLLSLANTGVLIMHCIHDRHEFKKLKEWT